VPEREPWLILGPLAPRQPAVSEMNPNDLEGDVIRRDEVSRWTREMDTNGRA